LALTRVLLQRLTSSRQGRPGKEFRKLNWALSRNSTQDIPRLSTWQSTWLVNYYLIIMWYVTWWGALTYDVRSALFDWSVVIS